MLILCVVFSFISRCAVISDGPLLLQSTSSSLSASQGCALFILPPRAAIGSQHLNNPFAIRVLQYDSSSAMCGPDTCTTKFKYRGLLRLLFSSISDVVLSSPDLIHLSTLRSQSAQFDLEPALQMLFQIPSSLSSSSSESSSVESASTVKPPTLLWHAFWEQEQRVASQSESVNLPANVFLCDDPDAELGFASVVEQVLKFSN